MKRLLLSLFAASTILAISQPLQAQTIPSVQWNRTFGGNKSELLTSVQQTMDGGYILAGDSFSGISGDKTQPNCYPNGVAVTEDYWIVKLNAVGNKVWDRTFGGINDDGGTLIQQTPDGGYIIGGSSKSSTSADKSQNSFGGYDYWIIKIDANGSKQWDKTYGGTSDDFLTSMQQTTDGGLILGGYSKSTLGGSKSEPNKDGSSSGAGSAYDFWILKLDAVGNKTWDKSIGGTLNDELESIQQTPDGGYILAGESDSNISGDKTQISRGAKDYWLVKINAVGIKQWDKTYGGDYSETFSDLEQTLDGGFLLGGNTQSGIIGEKSEANKGGQDFWVVKTDGLGNKLWDKSYGGSANDNLTKINEIADGTFLLSGSSVSTPGLDKTEPSKGSNDFWIIKVGVNGQKIWDKTIGGPLGEHIYTTWHTADNGYVLGGYSFSGIGGDKTEGNRGLTSTSDFWLVKLGPDLLGIKEFSENKINLFPNPTSGTFSLQLDNINPSQVMVSNSLGQVVFTKKVVKIASEDFLQLDLSKEPKGVYTIQILSGNQIITKKVVLQ